MSDLITRRNVLIGITATAAATSGQRIVTGDQRSSPSGDDRLSAVAGPKPTSTPSPVPSADPAMTVRHFYRPEHGRNLQPAFQAAIDAAEASNIRKVVNDMGAISGEMWCPPRINPFNIATRAGVLTPDGTPLVVRKPMHLDFAKAQFVLKGPSGGDRNVGQTVAGYSKPWLGGWLYVIGNPDFDTITVQDVTVDGQWRGNLVYNYDQNPTDKGFRIQDTSVKKCSLIRVELKNFGGEIYYQGGAGADEQYLEDCHFHGSPQSAFNPGGSGKLKAVRLKAGRAYQITEVTGGKGHIYKDCQFYDSGTGGTSIFGGPSPGFRHGYPHWFSYWDGLGEKPWIEFDNVLIERCQTVVLGSWIRGTLNTMDAQVNLKHLVGELRDVDLTIQSGCDLRSPFVGLLLDGPKDLVTQMPLTPDGTFYKKPHDLKVRLRCFRTSNAVTRGIRHRSGVYFTGGLLDAQSISISVYGDVNPISITASPVAAGFQLPQVNYLGA